MKSVVNLALVPKIRYLSKKDRIRFKARLIGDRLLNIAKNTGSSFQPNLHAALRIGYGLHVITSYPNVIPRYLLHKAHVVGRHLIQPVTYEEVKRIVPEVQSIGRTRPMKKLQFLAINPSTKRQAIVKMIPILHRIGKLALNRTKRIQ